MAKRKKTLISGKVYHVFTRSIAKFKVFRAPGEYEQFIERMKFYVFNGPDKSFAYFSKRKSKDVIMQGRLEDGQKLVEIIAYCIMPTHIHLVLKQVCDNGISIFMGHVLNSYSKYFNVKTGRKGPLWEGRFKNVEIETEEQLLHLTRYLHLNPTTSSLTKRPEDWAYSSYLEFLGRDIGKTKICEFSKILNINSNNYKKFVDSQIDYQKKLKQIEDILLE